MGMARLLSRGIPGHKSIEPCRPDCGRRKSDFITYRRAAHEFRRRSRAAGASRCFKWFGNSPERETKSPIGIKDRTKVLNLARPSLQTETSSESRTGNGTPSLKSLTGHTDMIAAATTRFTKLLSPWPFPRFASKQLLREITILHDGGCVLCCRRM